MSTSKISANFTDLNRRLSVFIEPKLGKNTLFLFLTLQMSTVNKPNPRARVPTQHQTNCGAARVTYRWARANAVHVRTPEKSSRESFQLLSHLGHFRQPPARAARAHFLGTPARSGTVAGLWATGESLFSLLLLQQSGSVCLAVCERVNVRVGRASSRFPPHQLSRPLRTVPPFHVQ